MTEGERPRRRRGVNALAIDAEAERGLLMRLLLRSPRDMVAGGLAFASIIAIVTNAVFLQAGHHPSPMFGTPQAATPANEVTPASPLPRPRPPAADAALSEMKPPERPGELKPVDPLGNYLKATGAAPAAPIPLARPPAPIPAAPRNDTIAGSGSRRVAAVQRALTEFGYGQLKPTGTVGADTQTAIQKFERERKLPITGQLSDRLVRELTAMIGHPID